MALGLLTLGVLWRTVRYLLDFPIWGDEALLAMNFVGRDYAQLTVGLDNCQVAPLLFLWGERAAFCLLGPSALSLRLLPFLAGIASLALYWRLTTLTLGARARLVAVGVLAVAIWPVYMSNLVKPYSFDLLMSLVLLVPAAQWLRRPDETRWLIALAVLTPMATLASYPVVFVAGGISLALARPIWQESWRNRCWFATYNLVLLAGFALAYSIGTNQLNTATFGVTTREGMAAYWANTFPPGAPLAAVQWFVSQTAGQVTAYPLAVSHGGTALFCLAGVFCWARRGRWTWLILLGSPLFLNLMATAIHCYPYGGACRLCQHLAPGICLFAGLGVTALIERLERVDWLGARRVRWTWAVAALFVLIGTRGLVRDLRYPYRDSGCAWMRSTMHAIRAQVSVPDRVVICAPLQATECVFAWYWLNEGDRVTWNYQLPSAPQSGERIWGFHGGEGAEAACLRLTEELRRQDTAWHLVKRIPYVYPLREARENTPPCELFCFERPQARVTEDAGTPEAAW